MKLIDILMKSQNIFMSNDCVVVLRSNQNNYLDSIAVT